MDERNELFFSAASIWEITVKHGLGKPGFDVMPNVLRRNLLANGYNELALTGAHALAVGSLPKTHRDPFDRVLITQATVEGIVLLTSDAVIARYPGPIRLV